MEPLSSAMAGSLDEISSDCSRRFSVDRRTSIRLGEAGVTTYFDAGAGRCSKPDGVRKTGFALKKSFR
jgi:hypothetical protein